MGLPAGIRYGVGGLALLLAMAALGLQPAQAQIVEVHNPTVSLFDPGVYQRPDGASLATVLPVILNRPIDDLSPRAGADAMAMGGAHLALADGAAALAWNPANLARLRESSIMVDGFSLGSSGSANTSTLPPQVLVPGYGDFEITTYRSRLGAQAGFGFVGGARPLIDVAGSPLVGGIGYRRHTEVGYGQELLMEMNLIGATGGSFPFTFGAENDERGFLESLTMGLGYEAVRGSSFSLSLGASANFLTGRLRSDNIARVAVRNFEQGKGKFQQNHKGFAVETGALAQVTDQVRLAAWAELPHTVHVRNGALMDQAIRTPNVTEPTYRNYWDIADYDMEFPLFASVGVAIGPIQGFEIAADYNLRPWSKVDIKHTEAEFQPFDGSYPAADVESFHVGTRFEFPLLREPLHRAGLRLGTMLGFRTMPLSMLDTSLEDDTKPPHYHSDGVEGHALAFGFTLATRQVDFHIGMEFQSYEYGTWFLDDQRELGTEDSPQREIWFENPDNRVIEVSRDNTIFRFSSELHL
ncbi:MAG: hypothetical protein KBD56_03025 [Candidatus Eisenbacteria bacterium]|nr:hypothetical protein [Candidatus Eisenbacteria bacterium]